MISYCRFCAVDSMFIYHGYFNVDHNDGFDGKSTLFQCQLAIWVASTGSAGVEDLAGEVGGETGVSKGLALLRLSKGLALFLSLSFAIVVGEVRILN